MLTWHGYKPKYNGLHARKFLISLSELQHKIFWGELESFSEEAQNAIGEEPFVEDIVADNELISTVMLIIFLKLYSDVDTTGILFTMGVLNLQPSI